MAPGAFAQWSEETVHTYVGDDEPLGVALEVQPLTSVWTLVYGIQEARGAALINSVVTDDGFTTSSEREIRSISDEVATLNIGGMSTSMDTMAFCFTEVQRLDEAAADPEDAIVYLAHSSGDLMSRGEFDVRRLSTDVIWTVPCDTGQPRNSLSAVSGTSVVWVADFDGTNSTQYQRVDSDGDVIHGPIGTEGNNFMGVDERAFLIVPGDSFTNPRLVRDPEVVEGEEEETCSATFFNRLWCLGSKALNIVLDPISTGVAFFKNLFSDTGAPSEIAPTVDVYSMVGTGGQRLLPTVQDEVSYTGHTFLLEENQQQPLRIIRSTSQSSAFPAGDAAIVDAYQLMTVWNDDREGVFQFSISDLFDGAGSVKDMFVQENRTLDIKIDAFDADLGQSRNIGGVYMDDDNGTVWFFHTSNQGRTWEREIAATDGFTFNEHGSVGQSTQKVDIAYDRSRDRVIIAYESDTGTKVVHKEHIITPLAVSGTSDATGLLDNDEIIEQGNQVEIAFGTDIAPLAESTGWGIFGTKLFLGFITVAMGVVAMRGVTKNPTMCVGLGGAFGVILAIILGLVGFWSITILTVFVTAAVVLFRKLEGTHMEVPDVSE